MAEKSISLEGIDPVSIYGVNNSKLESLRRYFSKVKIITRGSDLKVVGDETELDKFEVKFSVLSVIFRCIILLRILILRE